MKQLIYLFVGKAKDWRKIMNKYKIVYLSGVDRLVTVVEAESKDLALVKFYMATNGVESVEKITEVTDNESQSV